MGLLPALAGVASAKERVVHRRPPAKGDLERATDAVEADRWAAWQNVRYQGMSAQLRALYQEIGPRKYPRGAQQQPGLEDVLSACSVAKAVEAAFDFSCGHGVGIWAQRHRRALRCR